MAVADMPTELIRELLYEGFEVTDARGMPDPEGTVRRRMELELEIRRLGLR